ncbi:MAG: type I-U CRISPR-associated protein Cas5/Cas6 [Planctomycetaceae bacterium]|nr:type I-U CRISPR-associated protein Cas5/Cas6 [Planctomycetaceae bacterium]
MAELIIGWEYLTGYAVATDPASRDRAEWPPHPGRVFMALAAAWFETEPPEDDETRPAWDAEGQALRWLEQLEHPELIVPAQDETFERENVEVYVPVNDRAGPSVAILQSAPSITRGRQARTFPRTHVGSSRCFLRWNGVEDSETHRTALERLCRRVTRIGHSSSLVRMWLVEGIEPGLEDGAPCDRLVPDELLGDLQLRTVTPGTLDALPEQTQIPRIEKFAAAWWRVVDADSRSKEAKAGSDAASKKAAAKALREAKASFEEVTGQKFRKSVTPPPRLRPRLGLWSGYRREIAGTASDSIDHGTFSEEILILSHAGGPRLPLVSTLQVMKALRCTLMRQPELPPEIMELVSGHAAGSTAPLNREEGHLACVPLPFIGHDHADGHLLGVGLVFPQSVSRQQRGEAVHRLLVNEHGEPQSVTLLLGRLGEWTVRKRDWMERRRGLQPETWTAQPEGARTWASITPVVLDRFPKTDRRTDRSAWVREVSEIIMAACVRIGLPEPELVDVDSISWHQGSPPAIGQRRRFRGHLPGDNRGAAATGDGFPSYPARGTNSSRPQIHVWLRFSRPVVGPVLLGAGRYRGYGLCCPLKEPNS